MVKQLFVVNSDAFATTLAGVTTDKKLGFAVQGSAGSNPTISGVVAGTSPIQVMLGKLASVEIKPGEVVSSAISAYSAGTKQVITITYTGAATAGAAAGEYFVKVMDVTLGTMNIPSKTFCVDYNATLNTALQALEVVVDAEGAKADSPFYGMTSADSTNDFVITVPYGKTYRVAATQGATITYTTAPVYPTGTTEHITALENECLTYEGFTNKVGYPTVRPATEVVASTNYDLLYVDLLLNKSTKDGSRTNSLEKVKLIFAVKDGQSTVTPATIKAQLDKLSTVGYLSATMDGVVEDAIDTHADLTTGVHGLT